MNRASVWMTLALGATAMATTSAGASAPRLPIHFEENRGQADARARFLARGSGATVFLGSDGATIRLNSGAAAIRLIGSNPDPELRGEGAHGARINHYRGADPGKWLTGVPGWAEVRVKGVYPGIDQVYHGRNGALEFDFVLAPGADPGAIRFAVEGSDTLAIDDGGNLRACVGGEEVVAHAPVAWQGEDADRHPVTVSFVLERGEVAFALGSYLPGEELVIDPTLGHSTYFGTAGNDFVRGQTIDGSGNAYVLGYTDSTVFPATLGAYDTSANGANDAFVAKLDATGSNLLFATYLGGSGDDRADPQGTGAIHIDASGNIVLSGDTASSDFPTTANALQASYGGGAKDAFAAVLSANLGTLLYSTYLGGSGGDYAGGLDLDASGAALMTGDTTSTNFPLKNAYQTSLRGSGDVFVTRMTLPLNGTTNGQLLYSTYLGGSVLVCCGEVGLGIVGDSDGTVVVAGFTGVSDFPTTPGAYDRTLGGVEDGFVARFDPDLSGIPSLVASTFLGGSGQDVGRALALDASGRPYVAGIAPSGFPTTSNAFQRTFVKAKPQVPNSKDGFLTVLNPGLSALVYSTYLGGTGGTYGEDSLFGIAVSASGIAWATGTSNATNYPTTSNALSRTNSGGTDAVVSAIDPALSGAASLVYSTYLGGAATDSCRSLTFGPTGHVHVSCGSNGAGFPTTSGAYQTTWQGASDGIALKLTLP